MVTISCNVDVALKRLSVISVNGVQFEKSVNHFFGFHLLLRSDSEMLLSMSLTSSVICVLFRNVDNQLC